MRNRKHGRLLLWIFTAAAVSFFAPAHDARGQEHGRGAPRELIFFYSPTCHECQKVKEEFLPKLAAEHPGSFSVSLRDISVMENYSELFRLSKQLDPERKDVSVPAVYFRGELLIGRETIEAKLGALLAGTGRSQVPAPVQGETFDPLRHFRGFTPLAVSAAGLVDGINPCAFTVIVFFVSFLALQGFGGRQTWVIGLAFIAGVFISYLLIGLGLFGIFYKLSAFWAVRAAVNWIIGGLSILFGIAALIDAVKYARTKKTEGMLLSLPEAVKNRIRGVIGMRYRKTGEAGLNATMGRLALTAFVTGALVSVLEAVCTGQMYLPTIIFVLKSTPLKFEAFGYLVLYNLMFIVPLAAVLALSVGGTSSGQFSRFMARHFLSVKTLMALVFFALGIYLIWRGG